MKQLKIKDLHGTEILVRHPKSSLAQLKVLLQLIETEPDLFQGKEPVNYWINLFEQLQAAIKNNRKI